MAHMDINITLMRINIAHMDIVDSQRCINEVQRLANVYKDIFVTFMTKILLTIDRKH